MNCNRCNNRHCNKVSSHWNKFPWPEGRTKDPTPKHCFGYSKINNYGLATLFDVAFDNNPQGMYDVLSQTQTKINSNWSYYKMEKGN